MASEAVCQRCGGPNPANWHAPSPLWNLVMRHDGADEYPFCCPTCFVLVAAEHGLESAGWHLTVDDVDIASLWTDPDGRVWNARTCLWEARSTDTLDWPVLRRQASLVKGKLLAQPSQTGQLAADINAHGGQAYSTDDAVYIVTLEGEMRADVGDTIVRGVVGEYFPVKPDAFALNYEPVEDARGRP